MILKIAILLLLIFINGVFSATEMAFLSFNKYELSKELKKKNKKAYRILKLMENSSTFLSAIQIVITLSGFLASAFATESFASEIASSLSLSWVSVEVLTNLLVVIITIILSYFTLVFGELVPKELGLTYSKQIAFRMVNVIYFVLVFFKPFIYILDASTKGILKLAGVHKKQKEEEEDVKNSIVDANLEELEKKMLLRVFEFNDTTVEKVMTPKEEAITLPLSAGKEELLRIIRETRYTRFPVTDHGEIVGILNVKDLLMLKREENFSLSRYIRPCLAISKEMIIDDAFLLLNQKYEPMAKVMSNDTWIGIVTLEDIIEEVIGNVFDEYDQEK